MRNFLMWVVPALGLWFPRPSGTLWLATVFPGGFGISA